jgi:hypothetical protein
MSYNPVDFYFGAGIKYITVHELAYAKYLYHDSNDKYWYNEDHSPKIINTTLFEPVVNLGVKIGVAF